MCFLSGDSLRTRLSAMGCIFCRHRRLDREPDADTHADLNDEVPSPRRPRYDAQGYSLDGHGHRPPRTYPSEEFEE